MAVVVILILASLGFALVFLAGFIWSVKSGQYEDTDTPSLRLLTEDAAASGQAHFSSAATKHHPT